MPRFAGERLIGALPLPFRFAAEQHDQTPIAHLLTVGPIPPPHPIPSSPLGIVQLPHRSQVGFPNRKRDLRPMEDEAPLEALSYKLDVSLFAVGSRNKKRPNNLTLRTNHHGL
jgi:hypothetical protein